MFFTTAYYSIPFLYCEKSSIFILHSRFKPASFYDVYLFHPWMTVYNVYVVVNVRYNLVISYTAKAEISYHIQLSLLGWSSMSVWRLSPSSSSGVDVIYVTSACTCIYPTEYYLGYPSMGHSTAGRPTPPTVHSVVHMEQLRSSSHPEDGGRDCCWNIGNLCPTGIADSPRRFYQHKHHHSLWFVDILCGDECLKSSRYEIIHTDCRVCFDLIATNESLDYGTWIYEI
jgi:hypothetical protein